MGIFNLFREDQPPLVRQAFRDVQAMLHRGHDMFTVATACLLDNEILEADLHALDQEINQREQSLRRAILEHLTIEPERELIFSLKLISIVQEAERIGDLAKTIAKTSELAHKPRMSPHVLPLRDVRDRILHMFEAGRAGFAEGNVQVTLDLMREHEQIKNDVAAYLHRIADEEDLTPNEAVVYALAARILSRVSSHIANIASTVAAPFDQMRRTPTDPDLAQRSAG